jgi:hypothetical protein
MKLRVKENTQANYRGTVYGPGEEFECSQQESWYYILMVDCAEPVKAAKRSSHKKSE